ncbi:DUF2637 domain-containing protein [Streptomyces marianii]|uniref:DUF2637 domain-containing protein n=1 Tax=Streptomyces marianii TaxID=1817406 RepID=A0A5R9DS79_9ACTN|nr:DUF2637 domain-containing protein [Streptomyces marianii]
MRLNRTQRWLVVVVIAGAVVIAGIGFVGSYAAVRDLAIEKGFGAFAVVLPVGVDAGIAVLLALDLLLTWLRIPFPMLRQAAWLLTAATIGFNAAAAWPDPVGVGMHAVIPVLFVVTVEAARHAVGRLAAITVGRQMESVRLWRWLLAPLPTFRLWRRMMLWEIRKYDEVIRGEQQRLVYQARLRGRYGRGWRWKAPVEDLLPLRIARYGLPLEGVPARTRSQTLDLESRKGMNEQEPVDTTRCERNVDVEAHGTGDGEVVTQTQQAVRWSHHSGAGAGSPGVGETAMEERPERVGPPTRGIQRTVRGEGQETTAPTPSAQGTGEDGPVQRAVGAPATQLEAPEPEERAVIEYGDGANASGTEGHAEAVTSNPVDASPAVEPVLDTNVEEDRSDTAGVEHEAAIKALKSNAAAVRYAMTVLGTTNTPAVVDWLAAHGREVNRGQAHKITKEEEERQQKGNRVVVVRDAS